MAADDKVAEGQGCQRSKDKHRPVLHHFAGNPYVSDDGEKRCEQRNAGEQRAAVAPRDEINFGIFLSPRKKESRPEQEERAEDDDGEVEPAKAMARSLNDGDHPVRSFGQSHVLSSTFRPSLSMRQIAATLAMAVSAAGSASCLMASAWVRPMQP